MQRNRLWTSAPISSPQRSRKHAGLKGGAIQTERRNEPSVCRGVPLPARAPRAARHARVRYARVVRGARALFPQAQIAERPDKDERMRPD